MLEKKDVTPIYLYWSYLAYIIYTSSMVVTWSPGSAQNDMLMLCLASLVAGGSTMLSQLKMLSVTGFRSGFLPPGSLVGYLMV